MEKSSQEPHYPSMKLGPVNAAQESTETSAIVNQHFVVRADSFEFLRKIADCSVDCIWTDPPYFLSNGGTTCINGKVESVDKGAWDRSNGFAEDSAFHLRWVREAYRVLRPAGTIWVTGTVHAYLTIGVALMKGGFRILNDIIWQKPAPPPNLGRRCFTHCTETILWATKAPKGGPHRYTFNYEEMCRENGGKQMQTVWRFQRPSAEEKRFGKHPTQKPVALITRCLRACTKPGDIVLDPFAGHGSTGVAALRLGRRFIGCEVDEGFAKVARRRLDFEAASLKGAEAAFRNKTRPA